LTIHQAAGRYFPTPLIFAGAIIVVPTIGYLALNRIDAPAVAVIWALVYCMAFLAGILTFRLYAPQLLLIWFIYLLIPLTLTLLGGTALSLWTHGLSMSAQLTLALLSAAIVFAAIVSANPAIRNWIRHHLGLELR